jgi:hypothetical protein
VALRPTIRGLETALVVATCGAALALALGSLSPVFGQTAASPTGLRGVPDRSAASSDPNSGLVSPAQPPASYAAGAGDPQPNAAINYGRPRKAQTKPLPYPAPKAGKPPLPPLEGYRTSYETRRKARRRDATEQTGRVQPQPPTGVAVVPMIVVKNVKPPEEKPFDPVGVRVGSLRLTPYIEGSGGFDTNPYRVNNPTKGSPLLRGEVGTKMQSEWSQHGLTGELRLGYNDFPRMTIANRPDGLGKVDGKVDVLRDTTIDYGGAFSITTLRPGSPEIQSGSSNVISTNQPITWTAGGYLGGTQKFNRLEVSMRGTLDRAQTGDANFSDGSIQKLSLNDYTTIGIRPRISYEITPGVKPFVEATVDRRVYDNVYDVNGFKRSSTGYTARAGASFEVVREVTGEVSAGYVERNYDDSRLNPLRGPLVDASVIWTASPLTTVTLRASTTANETTIANASGAISRRISGEISHALLRNVTLTGMAAYQVTSYQGTNLQTSSSTTTSGINERLFVANVKAEYALTRSVSIKASYSYEKLKTTVPGSDYTANVFLLGLRLQR